LRPGNSESSDTAQQLRWTGAAVACFASSLARRNLNGIAPPGQLKRWTLGCEMNKDVDISLLPYHQWLNFLFNHPVPERSLDGNDWYWEYDYEVSSPSQLVDHVTKLCKEFAAVSKIYTLAQLNQGIWFIVGPCIDFGQYLRDTTATLEARRSCVGAMYNVYADFVSKSEVEEMETCFWMWWDILLEGFYMYETKPKDEDTREIESKILETLSSILQLDDMRTQYYALHGLGHLKHPNARTVVARYIEMHGSEWDSEGRKWLETCRDGTVM
jgi:hypothetical protein